MKTLTCFLLAVLLASCSNVAPDATKVPRVVPTVPPASRTPEVEMSPVVRGLGEVQAKNVILKGEVASGRRYADLLSDRLEAAQQRGEATAAELQLMREAAEGLERALQSAKEELEAQWETLMGVMEEVAAKTAEIAASEQEKRTLRDQVSILNGRVEMLSDVAAAVERERDERDDALILAKADVKNQSKWKWRFLGWALAVTGGGILYLIGRFNGVLP